METIMSSFPESAFKSSSCRRVSNYPRNLTDSNLDHASKSIKVTKPARDPSEIYPEVEGLPNTYETFRLSGDGLTDQRREEALTVTQQYYSLQKANALGFQSNLALNYSTQFASFLDIFVNNVGDPYTAGNTLINSKFMERALLDYFASLWNSRWPHDSRDPESYWGFALTMGSTEGNLCAMWNARDYLGGKKILSDTSVSNNINRGSSTTHSSSPRTVYCQSQCPDDNANAYTPIAFYSQDKHYSISKAMKMLGIRPFYEVGRQLYKYECPLEDYNGFDWPEDVPSEESGAIDKDALAKLVEFFAQRGYPILVCFNYGTSFKGAYDDVEAAGKMLMPILKKHNLFERKVHYNSEDPNVFEWRTGYWFHVDGALGAAYMPFIEMAYNAKLTDQRGPNFDFRLPFVHSIAMSGHKWLGAPMPCGVFMTKVKYTLQSPESPAYTGTPDTTFAGSRNGLATMFLWEYIARHSYSDLMKKALRSDALTRYTERRLRVLEKQLKIDLWISRTPLSLAVCFRIPNDEIVKKFSMPSVVSKGRCYSRVFHMEQVTAQMIDKLMHDLSQDGAFVTHGADTNGHIAAVSNDQTALNTNGNGHVVFDTNGDHIAFDTNGNDCIALDTNGDSNGNDHSALDTNGDHIALNTNGNAHIALDLNSAHIALKTNNLTVMPHFSLAPQKCLAP